MQYFSFCKGQQNYFIKSLISFSGELNIVFRQIGKYALLMTPGDDLTAREKSKKRSPLHALQIILFVITRPVIMYVSTRPITLQRPGRQTMTTLISYVYRCTYLHYNYRVREPTIVVRVRSLRHTRKCICTIQYIMQRIEYIIYMYTN